MLVRLVELIADERRDERLDAAGAERDQEQTRVEPRAVVVEGRETGVTCAVDERQPQHGVVLAEEAVRDPATEQGTEVHADDEGVEHLLGQSGALGLGGVEQQARDQKGREDVAHPIDAEALAALVRNDERDLPRQPGARDGDGAADRARTSEARL